jgi:hypothetical protein
MKKILRQILFLSLIMSVFASCKKDENQTLFEGSKPVVLTASNYTDPTVLNSNKTAAEVLTLSWNNPEYKFNTGASSYDVTYLIQVDTVGSNFTNPRKQEIAVPVSLSKTFKSGELNDILVSGAKLKLKEGEPHEVQMRIKATLGNNAAAVYSNAFSFVVTPHEDLNKPRLWITGSGTTSGWTNSPPDNQELTYLGDRKFQIELDLQPGGFYKFLSKKGAWQPQWGGCPPTGGAISENPGNTNDPDAISTPDEAGKYRITVDLDAKTLTIVKI